jgi:hypothetical protein
MGRVLPFASWGDGSVCSRREPAVLYLPFAGINGDCQLAPPSLRF